MIEPRCNQAHVHTYLLTKRYAACSFNALVARNTIVALDSVINLYHLSEI
jgi:hypothetical protein